MKKESKYKAHTPMRSPESTKNRYPHALLASGWWWFLHFILYVMLAIYMLNFVPEETAQQPWALAFADFMASWIPMLSQIKKIPGYHPFLLFHYSVMWAVLPILAVGMTAVARMSPQTRRNTELRLIEPLRPLLFGFMVMTIFINIALYWPVNAETNSWRDRSLVQNGFGIGWFGLMILWAQTLWFFGFYLVCERFYFYLLRMKQHFFGAKHG